MECPDCGAAVEKETFFCPSCGVLFENRTVVEIADVGPENSLSNRYVILSMLGRGGMGAVHLARDTQLDKVVALKVLPAEIASDVRAIQWMKEEVRIAQDMRHENIAAIHNFEADMEKQSCYIVMEFINGVDLHVLLGLSEGERLPVSSVAYVLRDCSKALDYAHSKRVIHRDIKPKNIMITRDGTVKVTDFGIARRLQETMSKISQTIIAGTPAYMAPEHLMGGKIDARADIYSLGATVYELLNGTPPFHKGKIDIQILEKEVPPLDAALFGGNEQVAQDVNAVMRKCLAKEPGDRYETTSEFYREFCKAAGIEEQSIETPEAVSKGVSAALVGQREMLTRTVTPPAQSATPLTPLSALEPTEHTPAMPADARPRRGFPVFAGIGIALLMAIIALALVLALRGAEVSKATGGAGDSGETVPVVEGPPRLAVAEVLIEGNAGAFTGMGLAKLIVWRSGEKLKDSYKVIEPLELKGMLESLGMKASQLTDMKSARKLYDERGIRYLILVTVLRGGANEIVGRRLDLKDGTVLQEHKPYMRWGSDTDVRRAVEEIGKVIALDDTHKKIYFLLKDADQARHDKEYEKALGLIGEALKLDEKDKSIQEYKVEFTESIAKDAISKCKSRRYQEAMDLLRAAQKYNYSPETVKELPGKMFEAVVEKGEREFGYKQYDKAIESYEASLKLKDDQMVRKRIEAAKKEQEK